MAKIQMVSSKFCHFQLLRTCDRVVREGGKRAKKNILYLTYREVDGLMTIGNYEAPRSYSLLTEFEAPGPPLLAPCFYAR